ncbi:hypothetical protein [Dysgonomonas reticulitermitis]
MKGYFFAVILAAIAFFTISCSGKYDSAITEYIVNTEMAKDVKVKDVKELKKVTVGDSINYIKQKAGQIVKLQIEAAEKQLTKFQQDLVGLGTSAKVITDAYTVQMTKVQQTIDSLKAIKPEPTKLYDGKKTEEVIAVVVEAKVAANGGEETIKNFILSPDGKTCYGVTDNPEMNPEK